MRDLAISIIVFGMVPLVLARPYFGVYLWSWLSYMNPHRLAFGFAMNFPFSQVTAVALALGAIFSKEKQSLPLSPATITWMLLLLLMVVSTIFSTTPDDAWPQLEKVLKIQFGTLMTLLLISDRQKLHTLVWVIALSMGFFGFKGGVFAASAGEGGGLVWGPPGTFIEGNNELALALLVTIPLMRFLHQQSKDKLVQFGLLVLIGLSLMSVAGSYSRGAFLASASMLLFLWWKGTSRLVSGVAGAAVVAVILSLMPAAWWDRMGTIETYDDDASAMGRFDAWQTAIGMANHRILGGGFEAFTPENFAKYGGGADLARDVHSIYFEILGEHGYIALALFLCLWIFAWRSGSWVLRQARNDERLAWHASLARMAQVSIIAYMTGGAFLGLAYFDLPYHILCILVLVKRLAEQQVASAATAPTAIPPAIAPANSAAARGSSPVATRPQTPRSR